MLRVLGWRRKEQAGEGKIPEDGEETGHPRGQGLGQLGPGQLAGLHGAEVGEGVVLGE